MGSSTVSSGSPARLLPAEVVRQLLDLGSRLGIRNIRVFGSFARGEASSKSDLDLLVEYVPGRSGFAFVEFCEEAERLVGRKVAVVTEKSLHRLVREKILARAVPLQ